MLSVPDVTIQKYRMLEVSKWNEELFAEEVYKIIWKINMEIYLEQNKSGSITMRYIQNIIYSAVIQLEDDTKIRLKPLSLDYEVMI